MTHIKKVKSRRIPDPNKPGAKIEDYWGPAQQMLADGAFLPSLKTYDKDNIHPKIIEKIRIYLLDPSFSPEVVKKASKAAYGLCCWVRAMESYDRVAKVSPQALVTCNLPLNAYKVFSKVT